MPDLQKLNAGNKKTMLVCMNSTKLPMTTACCQMITERFNPATLANI